MLGRNIGREHATLLVEMAHSTRKSTTKNNWLSCFIYGDKFDDKKDDPEGPEKTEANHHKKHYRGDGGPTNGT
jgi:hypothetical protein